MESGLVQNLASGLERLISKINKPMITYYTKLGDLIGNPDFRKTLDQFMQGVHEITSDLHRVGVWDFTIHVCTGEIVEFKFHSQSSADMFKFRHSEKLILRENIEWL